jgi:hypothetical protein
MSKRTLVILIGAALLFSAPAFAIDGQVLINQATVLAAGGFPYKITQPGSYKLSGNLVVAGNTDGIDINANNVVLDLNGFTISGPSTSVSSSSGVNISTNSATIKNGSVVAFSNGLFQKSSTGGIVEDVHASNNSVGIVVNAGIVRRCTATGNVYGIIVGYNGDPTTSGAVVENSIASSNTFAGIESYFSVITGNVINGNQYGLLVSSGSVVASNSIQNNTTQDINGAGFMVSNHNNSCTGVVAC